MATDTQNKDVLERLARALQEYQDAIPRQNQPDAPDLMAIFAQLDALEKELSPGSPSALRHYMHQKSYRKAWLFLRGQDSENVNGSCLR